MATFVVVIILDLFFRNKHLKPFLGLIALGGLLLALTQALIVSQKGIVYVFDRSIILNFDKAFGFKLIVYLSAIITILFSLITPRKIDIKTNGEYYAILIALVLGLNLMLVANNTLLLYLSLEIVSIGSYILVAFKFDKKGAEGSLKYLLYGAFSSALMLFGLSYLYGIYHTFAIDQMAFIVHTQEGFSLLQQIAVLLVMCGLFFKISLFPFYIWTPDVYEATPTPVVAFFSVAPKVVGVYVLWIIAAAFGGLSITDNSVLFVALVLCILATLVVGNFGALGQKGFKRLLAYSSIAHAAFIMMGVMASEGVTLDKSVLVYSFIYLFSNYAAFYLLDLLDYEVGNDEINSYKGIGAKKPFMGVMTVVIMVALAGLPPIAGFWAKLSIFTAILQKVENISWQNLYLVLFVSGILVTLLALYYYLKVPFAMYFRKGEQDNVEDVGLLHKIFLILLVAPLIILFFKPDILLNAFY